MNWNRTGLAEVLLTVLSLKFTKSGLLNVRDLPEQQGVIAHSRGEERTA